MSDDLRFQMMGLGGPGGVGAPAAPAPAAAKDDGKKDSGFPTFEGVIAAKEKFDAFQAAAKGSLAKLEEQAQKGASAQAKADARKVIRAYDHMLDFVQKGRDLVVQQQQAWAAKQKAAPKKK